MNDSNQIRKGLLEMIYLKLLMLYCSACMPLSFNSLRGKSYFFVLVTLSPFFLNSLSLKGLSKCNVKLISKNQIPSVND